MSINIDQTVAALNVQSVSRKFPEVHKSLFVLSTFFKTSKFFMKCLMNTTGLLSKGKFSFGLYKERSTVGRLGNSRNRS